MTQDVISSISQALSTVSDPELHRPITELGMVEDVSFTDGVARLRILLTISGCPMRDRLQQDISNAVTKIARVNSVHIEFGVMNEAQRDNVKRLLRGGREKFIPFAQPDSLTRVWGISSGKGGVGKSSVTVNLYPEGTASTATYYTGGGIVTKFDISAAFDGMVEGSISIEGNGALSTVTV